MPFWSPVRLLSLPKGEHYESEISFDEHPTQGIIVTKRYRLDCDCVVWLNNHLSQHYEPSLGLPVAQHEFAALRLLAPYAVAPRPLVLHRDAIQMAYAGLPLGAARRMSYATYVRQCMRILAVLDQLGMRHNDMLPRNVTVSNGAVQLIDFTLAEFGGISIMSSLPNPEWARPGEDAQLLTFVPPRCAPLQLARRALRRGLRLFSRDSSESGRRRAPTNQPDCKSGH